MDVQLFISFIFLAFLHQSINAENLKLCVVESAHTSKRIGNLCPRLIITGGQVECVIGNDRFNCLRRLAMGKADFTVLEPEDLVAASAYNEYNILVTNELRLFEDEKQSYEMVVIVSKDVRNIWDVKGKRFCHPGLDTIDGWTNAFSTICGAVEMEKDGRKRKCVRFVLSLLVDSLGRLLKYIYGLGSWSLCEGVSYVVKNCTQELKAYFQDWIILRECDPEKTLLEDRMTGLSNFFEAACVAGPWSADTLFDSKLKTKYRNLCGACDSPVGCYSSDKYHGREGALLCLTDNAGDIAWVRLGDALAHFRDEQINKEDYKYLCPDGSTRPVKFDKPCVWITKPWPVVTARSEVAEKVEKMMSSLKGDDFSTILLQLLENYRPTPVSTDALETPEDFLRKFPRFMNANSRAPCHPSRRVRWCVSSNLEENKCRWLREASIVYGIEPAISCNQELGRISCLKALQSDRADIFVARPDELLQAKEMNLKTIVQLVPKKNTEFVRIAAVVKQDSRFKSLKDLKGAKACFTGFRDVGWNAFIATLRNISDSESYCSDTNAVSKFFKKSSILGLHDSGKKMPSNLSPLTKQGNGKDLSAFNCMMSGRGDVAFIDLNSIEGKNCNSAQNHSDQAKNKKYRTLCIHESDSNETCLLTRTSLGAVVTYENITDVRREEIYSMLLEMDKLFGNSFNGETPTFSMYGIYDSNRSIIFPEGTAHLQLDVHEIQRVPSYSDILNNLIEEQAECDGANGLTFHYSMIVLCIFIAILSIL